MAMTLEDTQAVVDKAMLLRDCVADIENETALAYAGGTVTVSASDKTSGEGRANTDRASLKTLVDALTDF